MNRQSMEDFQGSDITLRDTIMMDTCPYTSVQTHRMNASSEHYGLWVIVMYQYRFIKYKNYVILVGDVDDRGGYGCAGQGIYGKSLYLPFSSAVNLKLL